MAANRKTDPLEVTQVILVALREEEKRRREGLRVGAGFVFLAAGLFIVLVVGLMNSWEATYMLIVALVVSIALFVVGQALGILLAELRAVTRIMARPRARSRSPQQAAQRKLCRLGRLGGPSSRVPWLRGEKHNRDFRATKTCPTSSLLSRWCSITPT